MREIKFRFWHLADQKMIDWIWITQNAWNSFRGDTPISLLFDFLTVKKHDVIIQQFTGLKDKNGNEIYEGDIIKCINGKVRIDNEWVDNEERYRVDYKGCSFHPVNTLSLVPESIEIIGNVHENPELLDPR